MWKAVNGYEGLYEVNECGGVRRLAGYWCVRTRSIKPEMHATNKSLRVRLWRDGCRRPKRVLVHRLVAEHFIGPIPAGLTINHKDGDRANNHVNNLEFATMHEQMVHAYATGLQKPQRGMERGPNVAKLTDDQVREIRARYAVGGITQMELAERFGVSGPCINTVIKRKRWNHVA